MPPASPRLRILSVGGNSVSAFLSWRLSATNACDVSLVWKSGYDAVAQYGIAFRSAELGNERFKPRYVVRTPEEAAGHSRAAFDYVLLCVKALPDVYDLASIIETVVAPQHTCILVNTTNTIGVESYLEQRFPTNVVLSLVSGAEISQLGPAEFEHKGKSELWVGAANKNPSIPVSIQNDMAEALSMTLRSGQVDCQVSANIRQQQYERMIGPIAFHPTSVIFETSSHAELLEKPGVRELITGTIDELILIAKAQGCSFPSAFREQTMEQQIVPADAPSTMFQDHTARRPMEVETYLGSPIKLAQEVNVAIPRIQTLYALLHNINVLNQTRPPPAAPGAAPRPFPGQGGPRPRGPPRGPPPGPNGLMNGRPGPRPGSRAPSSYGAPPPQGGRGGRPSMGGYPNGRTNGNTYGPRNGPHPQQRRGSMDGNELEEFSHLLLYDNMVEGAGDRAYDMPARDVALREREIALRQKELALREREYNMRRGMGGRPGPRHGGYDDDDDDDGDDFFDPMSGAPVAPIDDNFDMMSVTSRRTTRKTPSIGQMRKNPELMAGVPQARNSRNPWNRPSTRNRTSAAIMSQMPGLHEELMNNPLMGYSSDRYANVDRHNLGVESRTNSLTAEKLDELQNGGPGRGGPYPMPRRASQSPGHPLAHNQRPGPNRPGPPNGYGPPPNMPGPNGRPSPPGMRGPMPRPSMGYDGGMPQHVEQQSVVSNLYPPKNGLQVRSLTGSASASAGSAESHRSAPIDSEPSAHSSSSSLGPRPPIGVR